MTLKYGLKRKKNLERATMILNRCREHNTTISRQKLELRKSMHFAGHTISDGSIRPDDDFKQPPNIKELHSSLGLVAQFGAFAHYTACLISHLQQLLQKDTPMGLATGAQIGLQEHKNASDLTHDATTDQPEGQNSSPDRHIQTTRHRLHPCSSIQRQTSINTIQHSRAGVPCDRQCNSQKPLLPSRHQKL